MPTACQHPSVVYFLHEPELDRIKIGRSENRKKRLSDLATGNSQELKLLATFPGARPEERELHDRFRKDRIRGEWFRSTPELLALIEDVNAGRYRPNPAPPRPRRSKAPAKPLPALRAWFRRGDGGIRSL